MVINEQNPIKIPTIVVTPEPWQIAYSKLPDNIKDRIYNILRSRVENTATNPRKEELDNAANAHGEMLVSNYKSDSNADIVTRYKKAISDYYG